MKKFNNLMSLAIVVSIIFSSCQQDESVQKQDEIPESVLAALTNAGFNVEDQAVIRFLDGYLVERDIYFTESQIFNLRVGTRLAVEEQYSTDNLVATSGSRVITVYMEVETSDGGGGNGGGPPPGKGPNRTSSEAAFPSSYDLALDEAIARYNAEALEITFQRVTTSSADIVITRLKRGDERRGILGSAGFPTASGDPYGSIMLSGILQSTYGLSTNGIATIIAHEVGHCVGFRHTDYFDRSISCGGSPYNEGDAGVGANHIEGTPTGATLADASWMLSCTDGSDRPFNNDDKTALDYLY